jgi:diketogulonate reductase-like aldo/keto reductase
MTLPNRKATTRRLLIALAAALLSTVNASSPKELYWEDAHPLSSSSTLYAALRGNHSRMPIIGLGVGNLQHDLVVSRVADAIQDSHRSYLLDSAHVSGNEALVARGILEGVERRLAHDPTAPPLEIHVITKVWYTHLGYGRTKLALEESMAAYKAVIDSHWVDVKFHVFLHWPRCYKSIPWMACEQEESKVSEKVRKAGPDPSKKPLAWRQSWNMLEDAYLSDKYPNIESIGLANFPLSDLEDLDGFARVQPMVLQTNIWNVMYDPALVDYCHSRDIHIQVYNALQSTVSGSAPVARAHNHLRKVAAELTAQLSLEADQPRNAAVTPAQVILAWLTQHGISVAPRTTGLDHLLENSAESIRQLPVLTGSQVETTAHAVEALLSGVDLDRDAPVTVSFQTSTKDVMVYYLEVESDHDSNSDAATVAASTAAAKTATMVPLAHVKKGDSFNGTSYPGHVFRFYYDASDDGESRAEGSDEGDKSAYIDHEITASDNFHHSISFEMLSTKYAKRPDQPVSNAGMAMGVLHWLGGVLSTDL